MHHDADNSLQDIRIQEVGYQCGPSLPGCSYVPKTFCKVNEKSQILVSVA